MFVNVNMKRSPFLSLRRDVYVKQLIIKLKQVKSFNFTVFSKTAIKHSIYPNFREKDKNDVCKKNDFSQKKN